MDLRPAYSLVIAARFIALSMGLATTPLLAQSQPTLRQMAIEHGAAGSMIQSCGPAPSLAGIVHRADFIVEGIVNKRVSYLTADENDVYTDYDLAIRHVLFQHQMVTSPRPGIAAPIVFKSHGGRVAIDGLDITVDVKANDARVDIKEGDYIYIFARGDAKDGKWLFGPYEVFRVLDANVVTPDKFTDIEKSVPQEVFLRKIREMGLAF